MGGKREHKRIHFAALSLEGLLVGRLWERSMALAGDEALSNLGDVLHDFDGNDETIKAERRGLE